MDSDSEITEACEDFHPSSLLEVVVEEQVDNSESEKPSSAVKPDYYSIEDLPYGISGMEPKRELWRTCTICKFRVIVGAYCTISFHSFPRDEKLCQQWKKICKLRDNDDVTCLKICSRHFTVDNYVYHLDAAGNNVLRLKANAVPSLHLPDAQLVSPMQYSYMLDDTLSRPDQTYQSSEAQTSSLKPCILNDLLSRPNNTDQEVPVTAANTVDTRTCFLCKRTGLGRKDSSVSFHKFPADEIACKLWKQVCNLSDKDDVHCLKLCSQHFHLEDYSSRRAKDIGGLPRLKPGTVPSIGVPKPLSSRTTPAKYIILSNVGGHNFTGIQPGRVLNLLFRDPVTGNLINSGMPVKTTVVPNRKNSVPVCTTQVKVPLMQTSLDQCKGTQEPAVANQSSPNTFIPNQANLNKPKNGSHKPSAVAKHPLPSSQKTKLKRQLRVVIKRLSMEEIHKFQKGLISDDQLIKRLKPKEAPHVTKPEVVCDTPDKVNDLDLENDSNSESEKYEGNQKSQKIKNLNESAEASVFASAMDLPRKILVVQAQEKRVQKRSLYVTKHNKIEASESVIKSEELIVDNFGHCSNTVKEVKIVLEDICKTTKNAFSMKSGPQNMKFVTDDQNQVDLKLTDSEISQRALEKSKGGNRWRKNWYRYCYLCEKIVDKEGTVSLHKFPANPNLCKEWIRVCNLTERDDVSGVRICSQHFKPEDISERRGKLMGGLLKLKTGAIPCINVPNPLTDTNTSAGLQPKVESPVEFDPSKLMEVIVHESSPDTNSFGAVAKKDAEDLGKTKTSGRSCFLCGYKEQIGIQSSISMHKFPFNKHMNRLWKQACNLFEHDYANTCSLLICSNHFVADDYSSKEPGFLRTLKPDAVPSISVPNPVKQSLTSLTSNSLESCNEINPSDIMEVTFDMPESHKEQNVNIVKPDSAKTRNDIGYQSNSSLMSESIHKPVSKPQESPVLSYLSEYPKATNPTKIPDVNVIIGDTSGPKTPSHTTNTANATDVNVIIRDTSGPKTPSHITKTADVNVIIRDTLGPKIPSVSKSPLMPQICERVPRKTQQFLENVTVQKPVLLQNTSSLTWKSPVRFFPSKTNSIAGHNIPLIPPTPLKFFPPGLFLRTQALKRTAQIIDNSSQTIAPVQQMEQSSQTDMDCDEDGNASDEVVDLDDHSPPAKKLYTSLSLAESSFSESSGSKSKGAHLKSLTHSHLAEEKMKCIKQHINSLDDLLCHLQKKDLLSKDAADFIMNTMSDAIIPNLLENISKKLQARGLGSWSQELKTFALGLRFFSLDAYNYVNNLWPNLVPHVAAIRIWLSQGNAKPGFSQDALDAVYMQSLSRKEGVLCNITISEMPLQQQMVFENNKFYGGVDIGIGQKMQSDNVFEAQSTLIFFVTALNASWSIPIGYFFIKSLNAKERANLLEICLELLHEVGANVMSITLDGSPLNTSMCCHLGANISYGERFQPWFLNPVSRKKIFVFYDACCMMKLVRDALGDRDVLLDSENKFVKWAYVRRLGTIQSEKLWEVDTKLTEAHIMYQDNRSDIKLCLQTLSRSVYKAFMSVLGKNMEAFDGCYSTAVFCLMFNNIFDMLNCRNRFSKKKYRVPITEDSISSLLQSANVFIKYISSLKDNYGSPIVKTCRKTGFMGLIVSLTNIFELYEMGKSLGLKQLLTHKLSQDSVRTFLSAIQDSNIGSSYLNAKEFESKYSKLILKCSESFENTDYLVNGIKILHVSSQIENYTDPIYDYKNPIHVEGEDRECFNVLLTLKPIIGDVIKYMGGLVVKKILSQKFCLVCAEHLTDIQDIQMLLNKENQRKYIVPSVDVYRICKIAEKILQENRVLTIKQSVIRFLVLQTLERVSGTVFDTIKMKAHILEQGILDNHLIQLCHLVIKTFLDMRMI